MKKTRNFAEYLKESNLTKLTDDEIVISEEEEDILKNPFEEDEDEDKNEEDDDNTEDFEVENLETEDEEPDEDVPEDESDEDIPEDESDEDTSDENDTLEDIPEDEDSTDDLPAEMPEEPELGMEHDVVESAGSKVVYLYGEIMDVNNTSEPTYNAIEEIMSMTEGSESEIIKLYQLNIQPVSEVEISDGMELVYEKIQDADVIIVASSIKENNVNSLINLVMDRLSQHYQSLELKNKIFGCILSGDEGAYQSVKSILINKANNIGMLIPPASSLLIGGEGTDYQKFVDSINSIKNATEELRQEVSEPTEFEETGDVGEDGIVSFDEFSSNEDEIPEEGEDEDLDETPNPDEEDIEDEMSDEISSIQDFKDYIKTNAEQAKDEEPQDEDEETILEEEKDWNLPDPPKEMKNVDHIKTFKEMNFKNKNDFVKDPENKKMPKSKIDPIKGSSTETTIKGKKGLNKKDDLRQQVDNKKMPKGSINDTKGAKKVDSGAKVDVKYFSGKGKKGKEQANKGGNDIENFADWTKRI